MILPLHVAAWTLWRSICLFLLLEGLWAVVSVLEVTLNEPILGSWGVLHVAPVMALYGAGPCALAALCGGVAGTFADLGYHRQLLAASSAGIGPLRWIVPVASLGLLVSLWSLYHGAVEFPRARAARQAQLRLLLHSPAVCLRLLEADPGYVEGLHVAFEAEEEGRFRTFWAVEPGPDGLPSGLWRAERGSIGVPPDRDVLRFGLERLAALRRGPQGAVDAFTAQEAQLDRPLRSLEARVTPRDRVRESSLAELRDLTVSLPEGKLRRLARAELGSRLGLGLAPLLLAIAAVAAGLLASRRGVWIGTLAGVALVAMVFLPLHATCVRWVADGAPSFVFALPAVLPVLVSLPVLRRWRSG